MNSQTKLIRKSDGKPFKVEQLGYWSEIVSEDGKEHDQVKRFTSSEVINVTGETYSFS